MEWKIILYRFTGPLANLADREAPDPLRRGSVGAWRDEEAREVEDLADPSRPIDHGEDLHRSPVARTEHWIPSAPCRIRRAQGRL